jgi:hypothetical protein
VQGDERDVVLFSTAFSVNAKGVLPLNFGPLNRSGGERRLNVAVTRARRQVVVFCSFDPEQMRTEETSSIGVRHLRTYLEMAARGPSVLPQDGRRAIVPNRHREDVAGALRGAGATVSTGVGLSDFSIDLVLSRDGAARVAVLLDGPGWARRLTARDRDALPREVLQDALGWPRVERVWLPDWLANRDAVVERLLAALHAAGTEPPLDTVAVADSPVIPFPQVGPTAPAVEPARPPGERYAPWTPRIAGGREVLDKLPDRLATKLVGEVLAEIVEAEGPITTDRLAKLAANAFSLTKVSDTRKAAILRCLPAGAVRQDGQDRVVWPSHRDPSAWTGYRAAQPRERQIEDIPLREIANAMRAEIAAAAGMGAGELHSAVLHVFGLVRRTAPVTARLDAAAVLAQREGTIRQEQGMFTPVVGEFE